MLPVVPYQLEEIKNDLKIKALEEFGLTDAEFEGSSISQLINLLAYSTLTNNTNLTYGLNEMFISQAVDRKNVIKHARQMGYTHKRNLSFQYKIKLKSIKEGSLTVPKYSTFESNGNSYIYLGEDILDVYGTNAFIKNLPNEYNNGKFDIYNNLKKNDIIVTEDNIFCKVLEKYTTGSSRILIESLDGSLVPALSETYTQDIYTTDTEVPLNLNTGYRNFIKVGTVDTFLKDEATGFFKVQVTIDPNMNFPVFTKVEFGTTISDKKLATTTAQPIKEVQSIILTNPNDASDILEIQTEELEYIKDWPAGTAEEDQFINNVLFPTNTLPISEHHALSVDTNGDGTFDANEGTSDDDNKLTIDSKEIIAEFLSADIVFGDGRIQNIVKEEIALTNDTSGDKKRLIFNPVETPTSYNGVDPDGVEDRKVIDASLLEIGTLIKVIQLVVVIDTDGNRYTVDAENYSVSNHPDTLGRIEFIKTDGNGDSTADTSYDGWGFEIDYIKIEDLTDYEIILNYTYIKNFEDFDAEVVYVYDRNQDGYLDKYFYFSDIRGVMKENEQGYTPLNPYGWTGFYASEYDEETSVLYFDVSDKMNEDGTPMVRDDGSPIRHNEYVWKPSDSLKANVDGLVAPLTLEHEMKTPFRKTRFAKAKEVFDEDLQENILVREKNSCFGSVDTLTRKNEVEIIVKEGSMKRWNDRMPYEDGEDILPDGQLKPLLYDDLTIPVNKDMVEAGHFTIYAPEVEHYGIEMFVTRIMPDGSVEKNARWNQRDYLLAEHTDVNQTAKPARIDYNDTPAGEEEFKIAMILWERHRVEETFVSLSNLEYEDYIDIYTKYAGTGTSLSADFIVNLNLLSSKGREGWTKDLIAPSGLLAENFEAKPYITVSNTPHIMHAEGTDIEITDSIRDNAPKFSNTANRAVTKEDYKTICEAQQFISFAQVWGAEEIPETILTDGTFSPKPFGNIFISVIPYSKPFTFTKAQTKYTLDNITETPLFFSRYVQITGKESYTQNENGRKNDDNVLFSILDNYKIITLQLNYVKPIYLDINVDVKVLKYKFGQTIIETNEQIFKSTRAFMIKEVEQFDSTFFKSSLIKHVDTNLGDEFGLDVSVGFSVDLYDSYTNPEEGTFVNIQNKNLATPDIWVENPDYDGQNYPGYYDAWQFEMPLAMPIEDLFEDDFVVDGKIIQKGSMIIDNITNINTTAFCETGDKLYMKTDQNTIVAHNRDGIKEIPTSTSTRIEIAVLYDQVREGVVKTYKVGSYVINREENIIILKLNTHGVKHFNNPLILEETIGGEPNPLFCREVPLGVTAGSEMVIETSFPRDYFMNETRTMNVRPKNTNIKTTKNTYCRLKSVEFIEA